MTESERYLRTRFLERLAHDLRGAASTAGGALGELAPSIADDERPFLEITQRSFQKVLRLAESLAEAAEIERGELVLDLAPCRVEPLLARAIDAARALENRRSVSVQLAPVGALTVRADEPRLGRAVFELVSNALRAATGEVRVFAESPAGAVALVVEDDGEGCPELTPRFAPSEARRGAGLGLAFAVDVAAAHGGTLAVGRHDGRTRVVVTLPR